MRVLGMTPLVVAGLIAAAPAWAQDTAQNRMALEKQLIANETAVNEAVMKHDLAAFNKLVAADAWSVDVTGISSIADFVKMLPQIKLEPGWKISEPKVAWISDDVAVVVYHWMGNASMAGMAFPDHTLSSTVWARRQGQWRAVFHQETPAMPMKE